MMKLLDSRASSVNSLVILRMESSISSLLVTLNEVFKHSVTKGVIIASNATPIVMATMISTRVNADLE